MLLQLIYHKHRRAISPVVATLLMVALSLAAATVVVTLLNNINNSNFGPDTSNVSIGSTAGSVSTAPDINWKGMEPFQESSKPGFERYSKVSVEVTNRDPNPIYIFDIDIIVYGQKLDEIASWSIIGQTGDATVTSKGSYQQQPGATAQYSVAMLENNRDAAIPSNTTFTYEVFYGSKSNVISGSVQKDKLSELEYTPIVFDVAILDYGSSFGPTTAARQYENTIFSLNGTNNIFFRYNRADDAYDYKNAPNSIVADSINRNYDIVIVDVWAVPAAISSQIRLIHQNQTKLIFYGGLSNLGPDLATITSNVDSTATQDILGLTWDPFTGNRNNVVVTDNRYQFDGSSSSVLASLSGKQFEEQEDNSYSGGGGGSNPSVCQATRSSSGIGDSYGYDIAQLTGNASNFISYGTTIYDFQDTNLNSISPFPVTGALLVENFNDTQFVANETLAYSFIWKNNNNLAPTGADLIDSTHLSQVRTNMLTDVVGETQRVYTFRSKSTIDVFNVDVPSNSNKWFDLQVEGTIQNAPIRDAAMSITINMPEYKFHECSPTSTGTFYVNSVQVASGISVNIMADSIVSIDIGDYYSSDLNVGDTYRLALGDPGTQLFKIDSNTTLLDWKIDIETGDFSQTTATFQRAVDSGADGTAPTQVQNLVVDNPTTSSLDLSWDVSTDTGTGVSYYEIQRDGVSIANTTTNAYTDTGLSSGTTYDYRVRAVDGAGNTGLYSSIVSGSTVSPTPPPQVTGLSATATSSSSIDLSWNSQSNVDGYYIYRNSTQIDYVSGASTATYTDSGLSSSTTYSYQVSSVNGSLEGPLSGTANATTAAPAPATVYVSSISVTYTKQKGNQFYVDVSFTVLNSTGNPVSGATVDFTYDVGNGQQSANGITQADGTVTVRLPDLNSRNTAVTVSVTNVTVSGYSYDSTQTGAVTQLTDSDGAPDGSNATTS